MKNIRKMSVFVMMVASLFMTGCDASKIMETISKVAEGIQKAAPAIKEVVNTVSGLFGNNNNNAAANDNAATNTANTNNNAENKDAETTANNDATAVVNTATDKEDLESADDQAKADAADANKEGAAKEDAAEDDAEADQNEEQAASDNSSVKISSAGQSQMKSVVDYAMQNHKGASNGQCFNAVWGYLTSSGYGKLDQWGDLPNMGSAEAKDFAAFMNARQDNLDEAGLQRLDTAFNPPITNPHDPRIPVGAVIVVAAGSTGTAHPTAGDIVIKGNGRFINDGPNMDYGTKDTWQGKILGVYVPK
ncbi:MAG: hypothetical protein ACOYXC_00195 [Candidatus Rifleibacteriota bacterium]